MVSHFDVVRQRAAAVRALERRPCATPRQISPRDGRLAHQRRFRLVDNPHAVGTPEFARWRADWLNAAEDERE